MQVIFDSTRRVNKPAHLLTAAQIASEINGTPRPVRKPFAAGTARPNRERPAPFTSADLEWAAANLNRNTRQYEVTDTRFDDAAAESAMLDRYERGFVAC